MLSTLIFFLFITTLANSITTPYKPPDHILINFGLPKNSPRGGGWQSDQNFILASLPTTSNSTAKAVEATTTPYNVARIFCVTTKYSIPVTTWGPKLVRLYFPPLSTFYDIIDTESSFLSLTINKFKILNNFSAYTVKENANVRPDSTAPETNGLVREIYISLEKRDGHKAINLTFSPSNPDGFGFINGVEIISVPDGLYVNHSGSNMIPYLTGGLQDYFDNPFRFPHSIAMENIIRLNVGGSTVYPGEDSGIRRTWFGKDDQYFWEYNNHTSIYNNVTSINYTVATPSYSAPELVYSTMRMMGPPHFEYKIEDQSIMTWSFEVDIGFDYLVRLHFCELDPKINSTGQRVFDVSINNQMGARDINVFASTGGIYIPMYRDFITFIYDDSFSSDNGLDSFKTTGDLRVTLSPNPIRVYDGCMLNGLEIFKLSSSDGSLTAPNSNLQIQKRKHGLSKSTIIFIILGKFITPYPICSA
ncbi:unnamed protein product [Amaranthus hypochondriacus]